MADEGSSANHARTRELPLRPFELLATLRRHDVDFIVIGAFALAAHGYVRGTKDLNIVPEPRRENLQNLMAALQELGAEPIAIGDFEPEQLPVALNLGGLLQGRNWLLRTTFGCLDVMQHIEGMPAYDDLRETALERQLPDVGAPVRFVGYDDLVAMKRAAGRELDLLDIAELERARGAREPE